MAGKVGVTGNGAAGKKAKPEEAKPETRRSVIQHIRPFWDELQEISWVCIFPATEKPPAFRSVPVYGKRSVDSSNASVRFISIDDAYRPSARSCCPACLNDLECAMWIADPGEGYRRRSVLTPEQSAARVIGVEWPCSKERVGVAFKAAILKAHTDHGGTDEAMKMLIEAREMLTRE